MLCGWVIEDMNPGEEQTKQGYIHRDGVLQPTLRFQPLLHACALSSLPVRFCSGIFFHGSKSILKVTASRVPTRAEGFPRPLPQLDMG
jgi:hypothetical protein